MDRRNQPSVDGPSGSAAETTTAETTTAETITPETTRLGWIGTGVMGAAMCANLARAGYSLCVHSRTRAKAEPLLDGQATWADTPAELARQSDVIFTMLGFPADVEAVILGADGVLEGCQDGQIMVDMTTSEPSLAQRLAVACGEVGVWSVDAPVSGGDVGARDGTLSIMIGGDSETVARLTPLWQVLGDTWIHQGGPGAGQHTKAVNQILIASTMVGIGEALLYARRAGLDPEAVLESVRSGAAGSWSLSNLVPRILAGDFGPGFYVEHFVKDLNIALAEAGQLGVSARGAELARDNYEVLRDTGRGRLGTQALVLAMAERDGIDWD